MTVIYAVIAFCIVYSIYIGGYYPQGSDTMCHLYKGEQLLNSIRSGTWYPLYDQFWYNGVQMMRYWAPLPVYVLAFCQFLAGGDIFGGYLVFVALVFFFGALAWLYIGIKKDRFWMGSFLGVLWFFMPNNLFALFDEGNLPRSLSMIFLPILIYLVNEYMVEGRWKKAVAIVPVFFLIILCHTGYAGMIALALLLFCIFFLIVYRKWARVGGLVVSLLTAFALTGLWLVPSLKGGISSTDSSQVMKGFFQDAVISLNPLLRLDPQNKYFYFGLAAFLLLVFGLIAAGKKTRIGMWTALVIFICTTTTMYDVLVHLPGSQYLWMLRFISIALCMVLYGFLLWKSLKPVYIVIACVLLVLDVIPSTVYLHSDGSLTAEERIEKNAEELLITEARRQTVQRVALLDASTLGSYGQYQLTALDGTYVRQTFGAGWQSAATASNIVSLNEAVSYGYYDYLFDRLKEMGDDTVLIQKQQLRFGADDVERLTEAAEKNGYTLTAQNEDYVLLHLDVDSGFGVISEYSGIAIGAFAPLMCYVYPDLCTGASDTINDYTFEELSGYKVIYLSGFSYTDKEAAEELLYSLADAGVHIVIAADGLPTERTTGQKEFMGVYCQTVTFQNGYPILYYKNKEVITNLFADGDAKWNVTYFLNLPETDAYFYDNNQELSFVGRVYNDNISFIGLNLPYHVFESMDEKAKYIMDCELGAYLNELPGRRIVPITVVTGAKGIRIISPEDGVGTTLAYHDIFSSEQHIYSENHLLYVDAGETQITFSYPYFVQGLLVSLFGVACYVAFIIFLCRRNRREVDKQSVNV